MFDPTKVTVAERDQELGRWRYPDNPNWVVYLAPECSDYDLVVVCETSGGSARYRRAEDDGGYPATGNIFARAARAYFAAHPLPKPWHDAKPGEVWVLTDSEDTKPAFVTDGGRFELEIGYCDLDCEDIIDAKRVWPEVVES